MRRAADGSKLGERLDEGEDDDLVERHGISYRNIEFFARFWFLVSGFWLHQWAFPNQKPGPETRNALSHHNFRQAGVVSCVIGADHQQMLARAELVDYDVELLARRIRDTVSGFHRDPGAGVNGIFAAAQR